MTTSLGKDLVLNEQPSNPSTFEVPYRSDYVADTAKAGISINEDRYIDAGTDSLIELRKFCSSKLGAVRLTQ